MGIKEEIKREVEYNMGFWREDEKIIGLPLEPDFDLGITWVCDQGDTWKTFCENNPRHIRLEVTDMLYSVGAMHYYARLRVYQPDIINQDGEVLCLGGYGKNRPHYIGGLNINVSRKLKKVEKDMSGEVIAKVGEFTTRFNTPKEALDQAMVFYNIIFSKSKNWKLRIDYPYKPNELSD
jgi:hypothetical protein